jgi:hypothetical protein
LRRRSARRRPMRRLVGPWKPSDKNDLAPRADRCDWGAGEGTVAQHRSAARLDGRYEKGHGRSRGAGTINLGTGWNAPSPSQTRHRVQGLVKPKAARAMALPPSMLTRTPPLAGGRLLPSRRGENYARAGGMSRKRRHPREDEHVWPNRKRVGGVDRLLWAGRGEAAGEMPLRLHHAVVNIATGVATGSMQWLVRRRQPTGHT